VNGDPTLERIAQGDGLALCAAGSWTAGFAPVLEQIVAETGKHGDRPAPASAAGGTITLTRSGESSGAWCRSLFGRAG